MTASACTEPRRHNGLLCRLGHVIEAGAHHWHDVTADQPVTRWQCLWCFALADGPYPAKAAS